MFAGRQRVAERYTEAFEGIAALQVPSLPDDRTTSWHLYILRLNPDRLRIDRNQFIRELADRGVSTSVHFIPLHLQPVYQRDFGYKAGDYPVAEREFQRSLSLPIYSSMREEEIEYVISCVLEVASELSR